MTTTSIYKSAQGERAVMAIYDEVLAHWPVPHDTQTIPTRHGDTYVISSGAPSAPPLVLLHGAGSNSAIWAPDAEAFSQHFRVYTVDLIGEPGKSAPNRPDWEGPAFAEWLEDVLDGLQIESAALAGISQGSWTSLKFGVSQPERVTQMALMCPGGIIPDKVSFIFQAVGLSLLGKWGLKRLTRSLFGNQPVPDGVEDIVTTVNSHFKGRTGLLPIFTDEELSRLTMPIHIIGGGRDTMRDNEEIAARLRQFAPQTELTIIPEAGHALLNTTDLVLNFLTHEIEPT